MIEPLVPVPSGKRDGKYRDRGLVSKRSCGSTPPGRRGGTCRKGSGRGRRHASAIPSGRVMAPGSGCGRRCRRRWTRCGRVQLAGGGGLVLVRVHQHAATLPRGLARGRVESQVFGGRAVWSADRAVPGGLTTKVHMACDSHSRPMPLWLTGGKVRRHRAAGGACRYPRTSARTRPAPHPPGRADRGQGLQFTGDRNMLTRRGIKATIPE